MAEQGACVLPEGSLSGSELEPQPAASGSTGRSVMQRVIAAQIRSLQQQKSALNQQQAAIEQQVATLKRLQRENRAFEQ